MAESGLLIEYWANAVYTVVYVRNLILFSRCPGVILAEI